MAPDPAVRAACLETRRRVLRDDLVEPVGRSGAERLPRLGPPSMMAR